MIDQFLLQEARKAHRNQDYHGARDLYQQIAYSYNDFTELEKDAFTREMADFAGTDPMYHEILNLVISHIGQSTEPVLQSQLTKVIKEKYGERGAQLFRYVLYYADYRDDLKRIKKGRSYQLLLPHQLPNYIPKEVLAPPKKAQRKRTTTTASAIPSVPKAPRVRKTSTKPTSLIKEVKRSYRKGQKQANEILIGFAVIIGFFIWLFS